MPQEEIKAFMATAPTARVSADQGQRLRGFINEDFDDKGAICLREWAEQGNVYCASSRAWRRCAACVPLALFPP